MVRKNLNDDMMDGISQNDTEFNGAASIQDSSYWARFTVIATVDKVFKQVDECDYYSYL